MPRDRAAFVLLRDAEARFRLRRRGSNQEVVNAAVALLAAGFDAPDLAILAGDDRAESPELERDLDRALAALGLETLSLQASGIRAAIAIAHDIVARRGEMRSAAEELWTIWLACDEPEVLDDLAFTADGFVDVPAFVSEETLRDAASAFLDQVPAD